MVLKTLFVLRVSFKDVSRDRPPLPRPGSRSHLLHGQQFGLFMGVDQ